MITKDQLRKKFLTLRKKKYYEVSSDKFNQLINYIKKKYNFKKKIFIALYYPSNFEINIFQTLNNLKSFKSVLLYLKFRMEIHLNLLREHKRYFISKQIWHTWAHKKTKSTTWYCVVPLLAFDNNKNRLGYGKGFYDRYLNNLKKKTKK